MDQSGRGNMHPYFFGYGSLVNRDSHSYQGAERAQLAGWRRRWVRTKGRELAFLSVVPDGATIIDGLIAEVPGDDWAALDAREHGYDRLPSGNAVRHGLRASPQVSHYSVPEHSWVEDGDHAVLLSYLDVVVQGFLREYGSEGVTRFFATTDGWETPILNDRADPQYPRAMKLSAQETALVDQHLADNGAFIRAA
ncbi:gamma-glutamylcyclotransferase family protein [Sulfitobacter sp. HNIBRBA3233]|uniref:gamma-glutamylcyclotransferase family protein n=1 Tax=Sulfitobacter marinivivus TaxID=3158558 RepID=UPI0032DEEA52